MVIQAPKTTKRIVPPRLRQRRLPTGSRPLQGVWTTRRNWILYALPVTAAALSGFIIACGGDEDPGSTENATIQLCNDLAELEAVLQDVGEIDERSTVDELEAAREDVQAALQDVRSSAEDVAQARVDDLNDAYAGLQDAITGVEGEETIGKAQASIQAAAADVSTALTELRVSLGCPQ